MKACPTCRKELTPRTLYIVEGACWSCEAKTRVAMVVGIMGTEGPRSFTEEEMKTAVGNGATITTKYSYRDREEYPINACGSCEMRIGDFYLGTQFLMPAEQKGFEIKEFVTGEYCFDCAMETA